MGVISDSLKSGIPKYMPESETGTSGYERWLGRL